MWKLFRRPAPADPGVFEVPTGLADADEWLKKAREVWEHAASKAKVHTEAAVAALHAAGARDVLDKMAPVQGEPRAWEAFRPCTMGHRSPVLLKDNSVRCAHCGQKVDKA